MDINEVFRHQYGLTSRTQALDAGFSRSQISRRLIGREWRAVFPSIYRHEAVAESWESDLLSAVLATNGIASHRCAAALWHLDGFDRPRPEVSIPSSGWRGLPDVRVHRTTQWSLRDETTRRNIPCTGIDRTILDCAGVMNVRRLEQLAESAIRKNLTSWTQLIDVLRHHSARGRNGCLNLRTLLNARLEDQTIPLSDFSRLVTNLLVDSGLPRPQLEYRIVDDSGDLILQADLAWPALKKAWELDGLQWHFGRAEVERDRRKRNRAKSAGWNIQEILWSMYADDPAQLVQMARAFLLRDS